MLVNFNWLLKGILAGSGQIGGWDDDAQLKRDLDILYEEGIRAIVSLTEWPLELHRVDVSNVAYLHLPIPDMHPPSLEDVIAFTKFVDESLKKKSPVVVHCSARGCGLCL